MHNWFECKVSYMKMMENGMEDDGEWDAKEGDGALPGRRLVVYGGGGTYHRGDSSVHHGRVHRHGHQAGPLVRTFL